MLCACVLALASFQVPTSLEDAAPKPPDARELADALKRANVLLVGAQEAYAPGPRKSKGDETEGSPQSSVAGREWPYEGVYKVGNAIPIGYRIGGTSIVATALVEASGGAPQGDARKSIDGGLDFVLEALGDPLMSAEFEKGYDVRGWGHAYALGFLLRLRDARLVPEQRKEDVEAAIDMLVARLQETEIGKRGGWNYSRPQGDDSDASTFMTASTLLFLFEARRQGETVDALVVERALKTLEDARIATGAFQYASDESSQSGRGFEDVPGAIGRMSVCEVVLHLADRGDVDRIRSSIEAFFQHWQHLEDRRAKTGTHVPPYMIAPYYFFYAHRHVAQAIEFLPEAERPALRDKLYALLWKVREESGGWNDRVFPRSESFGTAMTVMALREPSMPRPAGWRAQERTGR